MASASQNPFFSSWDTPFNLPPFDLIRVEHFLPAFERGMQEHLADIQAIVDDGRDPDFDTVIVPLERMGRLLRRVNGVFWNLVGADTSEALQAVERTISPMLARHYQSISVNPALFGRVEQVWTMRDDLPLDDEQARVLQLTYEGFVREGAKLDDAGKIRLTAIIERLAVLGTQFSQNVLADEQTFEMVLDRDRDLVGLPASLVDAASQAAADRGRPGEVLLTLSRSLVVPFLECAERRELRQKVFAAWISRGTNPDRGDNRPIVAEMVKLRAERASLLGFETFADFKIEPMMAKTPEAVRALLDQVWVKALARAAEEQTALQEVATTDDALEAIEPFDWRYYAEKVRKARFEIDDAEIKPYFVLDNIVAAAFDTAHRLFGLSFHPLAGVQFYNSDVRAFDVRDGTGRHVAIFLGDYFARPSKRSGAWNSSFRSQEHLDLEDVRPIVVNVMNFAKGREGQPPLLSVDDARTLFHEFGHALHTMLSDVTYPSVAGTSVPRDFVEFPSQLFEHWLMQDVVLHRFALHAETGEPMPDDLVRRIKRAETFNQGFATIEYCASAMVDLDFHLLRRDEVTEHFDPIAFERRVLDRIGMPAAVAMRHHTPHFTHVFSGDGYSAGYYSYLWSEVLDADGFGAFEESGDVFDRDTADRLLRYVLAAGDTREPEVAYSLFRGRLPSVDTLLERRGLL